MVETVLAMMSIEVMLNLGMLMVMLMLLMTTMIMFMPIKNPQGLVIALFLKSVCASLMMTMVCKQNGQPSELSDLSSALPLRKVFLLERRVVVQTRLVVVVMVMMMLVMSMMMEVGWRVLAMMSIEVMLSMGMLMVMLMLLAIVMIMITTIKNPKGLAIARVLKCDCELDVDDNDLRAKLGELTSSATLARPSLQCVPQSVGENRPTLASNSEGPAEIEAMVVMMIVEYDVIDDDVWDAHDDGSAG